MSNRNPNAVGPRKLLLRTCSECGNTLPGDSFPRAGHNGVRRKRCHGCTYVLQIADPATKQRTREACVAWTTNRQEATKVTASNARQPWTEDDLGFLEEAISEGFTHEQIATLLGRTLCSVQSKVWVLANEEAS